MPYPMACAPHRDLRLRARRLKAGDAIVVEAHEMIVKIHQNSDHFAGMRVVADSKPPITTAPVDQCAPSPPPLCVCVH